MPIDSMLDASGKPLRAAFVHDLPSEYQGALTAFHAARNRVYEQAGSVKSGIEHYATMAGIQAVRDYDAEQSGELPPTFLPPRTINERARVAYLAGHRMRVVVQEGKTFTHIGDVRGYRAEMVNGVIAVTRFTLVTETGAVEISGAKVISFEPEP